MAGEYKPKPVISERRAAWLASDEYKAIAERRAAWLASDKYRDIVERLAALLDSGEHDAPLKRKAAPVVAAPKPRNEAEARAWLRTLAKRFRESLEQYEPRELFAGVRHIRWFVDAAQAYRTKRGGRKTLEQLLGLKRAPGRLKREADARKPRNEAEARVWLLTLAKRIKKHLRAYRSHETVANVEHLRWFADAAEAYVSEKSKENLERLLGLKRGPGHPKAPQRKKLVSIAVGGRPAAPVRMAAIDIACGVFLMLGTKSPVRKNVKGELLPIVWKEIERAYGLKPEEPRKLLARELPNIPAVLSKRIVSQMKARGIGSKPK